MSTLRFQHKMQAGLLAALLATVSSIAFADNATPSENGATTEQTASSEVTPATTETSAASTNIHQTTAENVAPADAK